MLSEAGAMHGLEDLLASLSVTQEEAEESVEAAASEGDQPTSNDETVAPVETTEAPKPKGKRSSGKSKGEKKARAPKKSKPSDAVPEPTAEEHAAELAFEAGVEGGLPPVTESIPTEPAPTTEVKPAPVKRIFFGKNKLGRLQHKLGDNLGKFFILDTEDAELEGEALEAKIAENKEAFKKLAVKIQYLATGLIEFTSGRTGRLNPMMTAVLRLLAKERVLVSGDKGNVHQRLISVPYSVATARAQGNGAITTLRALGVIVPGTAKQEWVPNERSVFLARISDKLGLDFVNVDEICAEADAADAERIAALKAGRKEAVTATPEENAATVATAETPAEPAVTSDDDLASLIDGVLQASEGEALAELDAATF
jgi:hypothetical protein